MSLSFAIALAKINNHDEIFISKDKEYACYVGIDGRVVTHEHVFSSIKKYQKYYDIEKIKKTNIYSKKIRRLCSEKKIDENVSYILEHKKHFEHCIHKNVKIKIETMLKILNIKSPFDSEVWAYEGGEVGLNIDRLNHAYYTDKYLTPKKWMNLEYEDSIKYHHNRVLYLSKNIMDGEPVKPLLVGPERNMTGYEDGTHIDLDLYDGYHRLGALIYTNDTEIELSIHPKLYNQLMHSVIMYEHGYTFASILAKSFKQKEVHKYTFPKNRHIIYTGEQVNEIYGIHHNGKFYIPGFELDLKKDQYLISSLARQIKEKVQNPETKVQAFPIKIEKSALVEEYIKRYYPDNHIKKSNRLDR